MELTGLYFECDRDAYISSWSFDPPKMKAGEVAKVREEIVGGSNPLYQFVPKNGNKPFAAYKNDMIKYGKFVNR